MAIKITEECINCGACEPECPNNAIYEGGVEWSISDGTTVKGEYTLMDGAVVNAEERFAPISVDIYYIVPNKCTECQGFNKDRNVSALFPFIGCDQKESYKEKKKNRMEKKKNLHDNE